MVIISIIIKINIRYKLIIKFWSKWNSNVKWKEIIKSIWKISLTKLILTCIIRPVTKIIATQETISPWFWIINSWLNIGGFLFEFLRPFIATIFCNISFFFSFTLSIFLYNNESQHCRQIIKHVACTQLLVTYTYTYLLRSNTLNIGQHRTMWRFLSSLVGTT